MNIALATCSPLPDWEVDDAPLHAALRAQGASVSCPAWDDVSVDWSRFDACLVRTTWDYQARREQFVAWARRAGAQTRLFNPPEVVAWNTHKAYLRQLADQGVPIAPTVWVRRGEQADLGQIMVQRGWRRAFIKPMVGASARGTFRVQADAESVTQGQRWLGEHLGREDMMIQPYLASVETRGELSMVFIDGDFAHGVRKVPVPGDYRVQDDFGAHDEPWSPGAQQRQLGIDWLRTAEELLGQRCLYARVDLLQTDQAAWVLNELELVEPSLFFRHAPRSAGKLARALTRTLAG